MENDDYKTQSSWRCSLPSRTRVYRNAKKHTLPLLKSTVCLYLLLHSQFSKNDICTSTIIVVFSVIHDITPKLILWNSVFCVYLYLHYIIKNFFVNRKSKNKQFFWFVFVQISKFLKFTHPESPFVHWLVCSCLFFHRIFPKNSY